MTYCIYIIYYYRTIDHGLHHPKWTFNSSTHPFASFNDASSLSTSNDPSGRHEVGRGFAKPAALNIVK